MTPEDLAYLHHILDAIMSIEEFSEGISSVEDLRGRRLERAGIERMLTIIGEAATEIALKHPHEPKNEAIHHSPAKGVPTPVVITTVAYATTISPPRPYLIRRRDALPIDRRRRVSKNPE
jgi:hypothetical protein